MMKLNVLLIFLTMANLLANESGYGQNIRVDIDVSEGTIIDVFNAIEEQSEFKIFYKLDALNLNHKYDINAKKSQIGELLDEILSGTNVGYEVIDKIIVITPLDMNQDFTINGKITDMQGNPLPGVNILEKGTTNGVVTNLDGDYTITVSSSNAVLSFSFVGFLTEEIQVGGKTSLNITLVEDIKSLEEVIVIGYGTQSRKKITGAIAKVSGDDIKNSAATGVDKAIQGKAAGVMVTSNTGEPGGGVTIRIRGTTSIGSGNDPLYVIDGIPLENTQTSNRNVGENRVNGMSQINPADIESIEILKDAAATSIYGARAANGVVLITTKRGEKGKGEVSFDYYTGISNATDRYDVLGASDYAKMVNEGRAQLAADEPEYSPFFTDEFINNPTVNTDWQDEIFRMGSVNEANLSLRGGTEATKYMVSAGFNNQKGIIIGSDYRRYSMRANIDQNLGKRITLGANLYTSYTDQNRTKNDGSPDKADASNKNNIYGASVLSTALVKAPTTPVYYEDGTFTNDQFQQEYGNPVRQATDVSINNNVTRIITSAFAKIDILSGLNFRTQVSGDLRNELEDWFDKPNPNAFEGTDWRGQKSQRTFDQTAWTMENYFTYTLGAGDHTFTALAGNTLRQTTWANSFVLVSGIVTDNVSTLNSGTDIDVADSDKQAYGITSYFGRLNYDYKSKYLLLVNARYDGSSRFGADNRYGFFPSGSVGWRISEESFMENLGFLTDWKVRASYGVTGNQEISNYGSRGIMTVGTGTNTGSNYTDETGAVISTLPSPNLQWEETTQFNVGTDIGLFSERLNFIVDYYVKTTDNLLFAVPLPSTRGIGSKLENIGKMENKGFEFAVNGTILSTNNFNWTADFNISTNANKVLKLVDDKDVIVSGGGGRSIARVGEPISFYLYEREKYVNPEDGTVVIIDQDESGGLPDEGDLILAGSPFPDYFGGFTNYLSYNNFDLSIFFQYSYGNKIYNSTRRWLELMTLNDRTIIGANTTQEAYDNRWQNAGDITEYPVINYDDRNNNYTLPHTGWLEDGSYLRLKSITLGYTLDSSLLNKLSLKAARVYLTANNLLTLTNYSGFDPEVDHFTGVNGGANAGLLRGYDYGSYPQSRTFRVGVNLTF